MSVREKRDLIDSAHKKIPIARQCELLNLSTSSYYYEPVGKSELDSRLKRAIDAQYTNTPFYGRPRMTKVMQTKGYKVNHKRVRRLMGEMGLAAIYPKRKTSICNIAHKKYPYLLRDVKAERPNQVWSADITYIRQNKGYVYLVAIMDWYSRYVLSWRISTTLTSDFCVEALQEALKKGRPEIFNTDQGVQFTSEEFVNCLEREKIRVSMDGRGRAFDNIFVERLWRSVKYECVFLNNYEYVIETKYGIGGYFEFYNTERPHQSLKYRTPSMVYYGASEKNAG